MSSKKKISSTPAYDNPDSGDSGSGSRQYEQWRKEGDHKGYSGERPDQNLDSDRTESAPDPAGSVAEQTSLEMALRQCREESDLIKNELEESKSELQKSRDTLLRKAAEFENLKKRTQKEKARFFEDARMEAVEVFLPLREDLKRSIDTASDQHSDHGLIEGLKLVMKNFDRILQRYGLETIEDTGVPFDVDLHDALLTQPSSDGNTEKNTVLQILEPGYKIGERIIKHAKVIVSQ